MKELIVKIIREQMWLQISAFSKRLFVLCGGNKQDKSERLLE